MRVLFNIDKKDYNPNGTKFVRPSVRGIIIRNNKIALIHSLKYDYYKFPGGGIENNENHIETLIREVKEESGLLVIPQTIKDFGQVYRIQKGRSKDMFVQDNYYYLCETKNCIISQNLDEYENEENFTLEFVSPEKAIETNKYSNHFEKTDNNIFIAMVERDTKVLEILINEGYFKGLSKTESLKG